ncbi:HPr kinase/phosphorylase [Sphingorhabdus arenilitoris]|uniref:HPr kinase/phosphorylase n=1 Tax=Sphingorhabdus arenilitoris TaxID=1490041 RepID=A0ABV8REV5_9SPHN
MAPSPPARSPAHHASAVAIGDWGVIITGPTGSGKSDLALRLIDRGAILIGDDYIYLNAAHGGPVITVPDNIAGKLEIRGIGIIEMPHKSRVVAKLLVRLTGEGERFPGSLPITDFAGCSLPTLSIDAFHYSSPIKIEYALKSLVDRDLPPVA